DQIRFYPIEAAELLRFRDDFIQGKARIEVREEVFRLREYNRFLATHRDDIAAFKSRQQAAFAAERERWALLPSAAEAELDEVAGDDALDVRPGCTAQLAHVPGSVWKIAVSIGDRVQAGDALVVLESMKMEIPVSATVDGIVEDIVCAEGR